MAFTEQDIATLKQAKAQGKTKEQALALLAQSQAGTQTETRFGDVGEDVVSGIKGVGSDLMQRGQNVLAAGADKASGKQGLLETSAQMAGQIVGGATDIIGRGVTTLGKLFTRESEEKAIKEKVDSTIEATGIPEVIGSLSDRTKRNLAVPAALFELATIKGLSSVAKQPFKQADDVLKSSIAKNPPKAGTTFNAVKDQIKDVRFQLSDIDPQVETALKRSDMNEVNTYFQQAKNAAADTRKPTPLEIAGSKAENAFDVIDTARIKAIEGKKAILNEVGTNRVTGNTLNDVMSQGIQTMNDRFGIKINADGTITDAAGRVSKLDDVDAKLVSEYFSKLNSLGVSPSIKQVDDFVDWAQSQLYKQSKTLSTLDAADKAVIGNLKQITGDLNTRLKEQVGGGYGEANARIGQLIEMQDELSRALGADARKGGGLMKRLFSPTGGQTRQMFDQIFKETGIDLDKEANLARFAMDSVGDVRQKSLLKELDAGFAEAADLDITKPLSIIRFIREKADLDEQELANEIIKRANASSDNI